MFKGRKQSSFDITEHPDVVKALNAMWDTAYERGRSDEREQTLEGVRDLRATAVLENGGYPGDRFRGYINGIDDVIKELES